MATWKKVVVHLYAINPVKDLYYIPSNVLAFIIKAKKKQKRHQETGTIIASHIIRHDPFWALRLPVNE